MDLTSSLVYSLISLSGLCMLGLLVGFILGWWTHRDRELFDDVVRRKRTPDGKLVPEGSAVGHLTAEPQSTEEPVQSLNPEIEGDDTEVIPTARGKHSK